ncbi:fatty acid--CoA ligase family protein [Fervidobacterium pennivorans subsp. shakshaketiis]|jgi:acyl-coenzyme A synthetase/AMP-(fatty) acid ligase|uniref:class I adenylate-forming enzyme family protein n=1 Tax=Fervidobacterium pennivorans TaxID=93466 RepID=UPI00355AD78E
MSKLFLIDPKRGIEKTYHEFFKDIENIRFINKVIKASTPYEVFLMLVRSLIEGIVVDLLDSDLSESEIQRLGIDEDMSAQISLKSVSVPDSETFFELIKAGAKSWKIGLYTSGTTGRPKKVYHTFASLTRNVKTGDKYADNVWAFAYNPTHVAGVQVFFQALMNENPMIYVFDMEKSEIPNAFYNYGITNISATPTFYRTVLALFDKPVLSVTRVTLGGEKYDPNLENEIKRVFPNAKITNIYASTEAGTLLTANQEYFDIPEDRKNFFKIAEDGELLVHVDYLGESTELVLDGEWYHTGDIVELTEEGKIKFIGRKNEMINVGGYKVNPNEVEEEIKKLDFVLDAYVYGKRNQVTGNILVAEVVLKSNVENLQDVETAIYRHLQNNLQSWKIPRIIKFVDEVKLTRTGKKVRR